MFDLFWWPSVLASIQKLPRETVIIVAGAYVVLEIHRRNTNVRIAEANAKAKAAEAELRRLQQEK